jgi:peptidyl-tRNA hydrolase, PTH1 family
MKLIVGLGNPGRAYQGTRHNIGFEVLGQVASRLSSHAPRAKFSGELSEGQHVGERVFLLAPLTFMNRSGQSVVQARDFYDLPNSDLLVICDDFQLPVGKIRFRARGTSGGQKGLEDILRHCGQDIPRLRVGIGPVPPRWEVVDYVLGRFSATERSEMDEVLPRAVQGVLDWIQEGTEYCMNRYNGN